MRVTRHSSGLLSAVSAAIAVAGLAAVPTAASAAAGTVHGASARTQRVCPVPGPGQVACQAVYRTVRARAGNASAAATAGGYGPASLRGAYNLTHDSAVRGRHETIAIVDAFRDPDAAKDLAAYRSHFHLGACTTASGCLRIVNETGKTSPLPHASESWATEESLDLDMVSAICPHCRILLVEASTTYNASMGKAEDTAARHARFVSNSWSGTENRADMADNHYFNHPGDALVFAAGDTGYGTAYPADLQYVTAVGGTTLTHRQSGSRDWTETVWGTSPADGTGSGCSSVAAKPSWQRAAVDIGPGGCKRRTENDVAAIGNPYPGVAIYDSYGTFQNWNIEGGTSVATPIVAATYALAGDPAARSYPSSYLYQHPGHFHDVTSGSNGNCSPARAYLCTAEVGYDGPTGLGTPLGIAGFSRNGTDPVTVVDPGSKTATPGTAFSAKLVGLDSRASATSLRFSATGLPAGLHIKALAGSTDGEVYGTVPGSVTVGQVFSVTVQATDAQTHKQAQAYFTITIG